MNKSIQNSSNSNNYNDKSGNDNYYCFYHNKNDNSNDEE